MEKSYSNLPSIKLNWGEVSFREPFTSLSGIFETEDGKSYEIKLTFPEDQIPEGLKSIFERNVRELVNKIDGVALTTLSGHKIECDLSAEGPIQASIFKQGENIKDLTSDLNRAMKKLQGTISGVMTATLLGCSSREESDMSGEVRIELGELKLPTYGLSESPKQRKEQMDAIFDIYTKGFCPQANRKNLEKYVQSKDFMRHCKSAKAYYNDKELTLEDAFLVMTHREPCNIAMSQLYDKRKLEAFFGFSESAFNDISLLKSDDTFFAEQPNTVSVYSETYLWDPPGGKRKREIACLSLPAPALDTKLQPQWHYYMDEGRLRIDRYKKEMDHLAETVIRAAIDNKRTAFRGKGLKRLLLTRYGLGVFLATLNPQDRKLAAEAYYSSLTKVIKAHKDELQGLEIAISVYSPNKSQEVEKYFIDVLKSEGIKAVIVSGDIAKNAPSRTLIVNAWDPHSIPGNGNDADASLDGILGRSTGIPVVQNPWMNYLLYDLARYIAVHHRPMAKDR